MAASSDHDLEAIERLEAVVRERARLRGLVDFIARDELASALQGPHSPLAPVDGFGDLAARLALPAVTDEQVPLLRKVALAVGASGEATPHERAELTADVAASVLHLLSSVVDARTVALPGAHDVGEAVDVHVVLQAVAHGHVGGWCIAPPTRPVWVVSQHKGKPSAPEVLVGLPRQPVGATERQVACTALDALHLNDGEAETASEAAAKYGLHISRDSDEVEDATMVHLVRPGVIYRPPLVALGDIAVCVHANDDGRAAGSGAFAFGPCLSGDGSWRVRVSIPGASVLAGVQPPSSRTTPVSEEQDEVGAHVRAILKDAQRAIVAPWVSPARTFESDVSGGDGKDEVKNDRRVSWELAAPNWGRLSLLAGVDGKLTLTSAAALGATPATDLWCIDPNGSPLASATVEATLACLDEHVCAVRRAALARRQKHVNTALREATELAGEHVDVRHLGAVAAFGPMAVMGNDDERGAWVPVKLERTSKINLGDASEPSGGNRRYARSPLAKGPLGAATSRAVAIDLVVSALMRERAMQHNGATLAALYGAQPLRSPVVDEETTDTRANETSVYTAVGMVT